MAKSTNQVPRLIVLCHLPGSIELNELLQCELMNLLQAGIETSYLERGELILRWEGGQAWKWVVSAQQASVQQISDNSLQQIEKLLAGQMEGRKPAVLTTLPVIFQLGGPLGAIKVALFHSDKAAAKYIFNKAIVIGRHVADTLQNYFFSRLKDPNARRLALWLETITAITSTLEIPQVLHVVTQLTADLFKGRCCFYLIDETTRTLVPAAAVGMYDLAAREKFKSLSGRSLFPIMEEAIRLRRPIAPMPEEGEKYFPADICEFYKTKWIVVAPMLLRDRVSGFLQVDVVGRSQNFTDEEIEIIFALAREAAIAIENSSLVRRLIQNEQRLHQLFNKTVSVQEEERLRVAMEIHDGVLQGLLGIWYQLQRMVIEVHLHDQRLAKKLGQINEGLGLQIYDIRRIVRNFRPIILDNHGLLAAINSLVETFRVENKLQLNLVIEGEPAPISPEIETAIYRILQEALANVQKHSQATHLSVKFSFQSKNVRLVVEDNGIGFNAEDMNSLLEHGHLGLVSMQERVILLGGSWSVTSKTGKGTALRILIPTNPQEGSTNSI